MPTSGATGHGTGQLTSIAEAVGVAPKTGLQNRWRQQWNEHLRQLLGVGAMSTPSLGVKGLTLIIHG